MLADAGVILQALLFVGAAGWCVFFIKRLPEATAELRRTFKRYRTGSTTDFAHAIKEKRGQRGRFRKECAKAFWARLAIEALFFWPVTIFAVVIIVSLASALYQEIAGGL